NEGVRLLDAVDAMERQARALKEQDLRLTDLKRRWDSLGEAQKRAISGTMTAQDNLRIGERQAAVEEVQRDLDKMTIGQLKALSQRDASLAEWRDKFMRDTKGMELSHGEILRQAVLDAEDLLLVEQEIDQRRRRR